MTTAIQASPAEPGRRLLKAFKNGKPSLAHVRQLIGAGADPDMRDETDRTALHIAAEYGFLDLVEALIDAGADINAQDRYKGYTPLITAVARGQFEIAFFLLTHHADVNRYTCPAVPTDRQSGGTALSFAIGCKHPLPVHIELVHMLIAQGADIEARYRHRDTALMLATRSDSLAYIKILLEAGADLDKTNEKGETALDIARQTPGNLSGQIGSATLIADARAAGAEKSARKKWAAAQNLAAGMPLTTSLHLRRLPSLKKGMA